MLPANSKPKSSAGSPGNSPGDYLVLAEGKMAGNRLALKSPCVHLGSDSLCDIWLPHEGIKSWHAVLLKNGQGWSVKALDPSFPVIVNGQASLSTPLRNGDRLNLGKLIFILDSNTSLESGTRDDANELWASLRIHASALSASHMELHQRELSLAGEKQKWKTRCRQIAKELERRHQILRKKASLLHRAANKNQTAEPLPPKTPREIPAPAILNQLLPLPAQEEKTRGQRKNLAQLYWKQRKKVAQRFLAWDKALTRREAALERCWQALVTRHKKQEEESSALMTSLTEREAAFRERLLDSERSLAFREKALKTAEQNSAVQSRRVSEETEKLRASQRDWVSRLEALHREETGLKRRIENLAKQIEDSKFIGPGIGLFTQAGTENPVEPKVGTVPGELQLENQNPQSIEAEWALVLSESLSVLTSQRETLVRQAEALAQRDLEWVQEQKATSQALEESWLRLAQQEHMLAEKHAQLDRFLEENAILQEKLETQTKELVAQRKREMETAAVLHRRLSVQESFLAERQERLSEMELSVQGMAAREHSAILHHLELAREAVRAAESREKSLELLEKELQEKLEDNHYHWQSMALERAELEALRAEILGAASSRDDSVKTKLKEARASAAERTAGWVKILENQRAKLSAELAVSRTTWKKLADLLDELDVAVEAASGRKTAANQTEFGRLRFQEEAAFWREEFERVNAEITARESSHQVANPARIPQKTAKENRPDPGAPLSRAA